MLKSSLSAFAAVLLMFIVSSGLYAQQQGCTDPQAVNFQSNAKVNDGSCRYNLTLYKPEIRFLLSKEVDETSGLLFWRNSLWTHNDSGGLPILYKLDTTDGTVKQRITVKGVANVDWEELADDSLYIYVGDFGNNSGHRNDLVIYKIKKSDIPQEGDDSVATEKIFFTYPDYPEYIEGRSENNYDCEAMVSVGDSLYLFSKDWQDARTRMYRLPKSAGNYVADLIAGFDAAGLITAADYNQERNEMVLLGYTNHEWIPFMWLLFDFQGKQFFSGNKRRIDMPQVTATQTEGLVFSKGDGGFISSESNPLFMPTMYHFDIGKWTGLGTTSVQKLSASKIDFTLSPNPIHKGKLSIHLENIPLNSFSLELYDSLGRQVLPAHYKAFRKKGKASVKLSVSALKPGIYFVRLRSGGFMVERKFIKE
jgi:hypothetical protein